MNDKISQIADDRAKEMAQKTKAQGLAVGQGTKEPEPAVNQGAKAGAPAEPRKPKGDLLKGR